jgi:serine/threonine-protein kinase HipA
MMVNMQEFSFSSAARGTTIEVHANGRWQAAATIQALGADRCRFEYLPEYVFSEENPQPVALGLPVGIEADRFVEGLTGREPDRRPPAFVYDLVPQGRGRRYLLDRLGLADAENMLLPLVMNGAFNPIGCLRFESAMEFFREEAARGADPGAQRGFSMEEVLNHSEEFLEHLSLHAMLAAGTTGVQGVAPKFLLTTDEAGRWFADMALPDERATTHWLLKLPRGRSEADRTVLRNEAGYLRLAAACGLRMSSTPQLQGEVLFVRRFDRVVVDGQVQRLHQESLASICDLRGFGLPKSQHFLLSGLRSVVSDPFTETVEFIRRDVLNLAMRNTDNHARNTAVQRLVDGTVRLTPLFDFAPMFLDPEVVARGCHWRDDAGKLQRNWSEVIETLQVSDQERERIAHALHAFAPTVAALADTARECGVEQPVIEACRGSIDAQALQLDALRDLLPKTPRSKPRG